jgi:hypothetical protein
MNIRRGLWRAWIFVTVLWIIGASALAFVVLPDNVARKYQYIYNMREDVGDPNSVDWTKDFYALMQSPSRNMLPAAFDILAYQNVASSDGDVKKGTMIAVDFPDRSRLYMSAQMTKDDQNYVSKAFWDQRWKRYGTEALPFIGGALIPPLVLLILGSFLMWVGRGFARE